MKLLCHPENFELLRQGLAKPEGKMSLNGVPVYVSPLVPKHPRRWVFPKDWSSRFIKYDKSDEAWAIPLGYGHWEEDTTKREFVVVDDRYEIERFPEAEFGVPKELMTDFTNYTAARIERTMFDQAMRFRTIF